MFQLAKEVPFFDVLGLVTIVDQENSIYTAYRNTMTHASLFLDQLHVKNTMTVLIENKRASYIYLYQRACSSPYDTFKTQYGPKTAA